MFAIMVRPGGERVAIAGSLRAACVPELDAVLRHRTVQTLDCSEIRRVDREGAMLLARWRRSGGALVGVSPLLSLLLEAESEAESSGPDDRSMNR